MILMTLTAVMMTDPGPVNDDRRAAADSPFWRIDRVSVSQTTIDQYGFAGRLEGRWSL